MGMTTFERLGRKHWDDGPRGLCQTIINANPPLSGLNMRQPVVKTTGLYEPRTWLRKTASHLGIPFLLTDPV